MDYSLIYNKNCFFYIDDYLVGIGHRYYDLYVIKVVELISIKNRKCLKDIYRDRYDSVKINYLSVDVLSEADFIRVMLEIDKKYPDLGISKKETLDGVYLIDGNKLPLNPFCKHYVKLEDGKIIGMYWETGRLNSYAEFKSWKNYYLTRLDRYFRFTDIPENEKKWYKILFRFYR